MDLIITQLGTATVTGQGYPAKAKSAGAHTLQASVVGVSGAAVALTGSLMGTNDLNAVWVKVTDVSASGTSAASVALPISGDYAFWRFDWATLTGSSASASISTDPSSAYTGEPVTMLNGTLTRDGAAAVRPDASLVAAMLPGLINFKRSNATRLADAYIAAIEGSDRVRVVTSSDSMFAGTGSTNNLLVNARSKAWPRQLSEMLKSLGATAYETWACGNGSNGGNIAATTSYMPELAFGASAALSGTYFGVAGPSYELKTDTNSWVELTLREPHDTLDICHAVATGTGVFRVLDQAGTQIGSNINTVAGTNGVLETTLALPAGTTKVRLVWVSGALVLIGGFGTRYAAKKGVEIINASQSGAETFMFTDTGGNAWGSHRPSIAQLFRADTKNVYVMGGGYNDIYIAGQTLETVKSRMRTRLTHLAGLANTPDVVVVGYPPFSLSLRTEAQQIALEDALRSVAVDEFDRPFISLRTVMPAQAWLQARGRASADGLHLRAKGMETPAQCVLAAMLYAASLA